MSVRKQRIILNSNLVSGAGEALDLMAANPDHPVDVSHTPIGSLTILKSLGAEILISGDNAFAIMGIPTED